MPRLKKGYVKDFTIVDNHIFKDKRLSYKELGLLCELLSLPDDWDFSIKGISSLHSDGEKAVRTGLIELEKLGYLIRKQIKGKYGQFDGYDYYIFDNPNDNREPYVQNRLMDKGHAVKETQLITKESNNKKINSVVDEQRFKDAVYIEKIRFDEADRTDEYSNKAIQYAINSLSCFSDKQIERINNFKQQDYLAIFRKAYGLVNDECEYKNIDNPKAYLSYEIKRRLKMER